MINRFKKAWLVFRKPYLFQSSLLIDKAVIKGSVEADVILEMKDGSQKKISYKLTAT